MINLQKTDAVESLLMQHLVAECCRSGEVLMMIRGKKTDLRIVKTHIQLWEALVGLIVEKGYEKITVNEICKTAMINRSTFYRHFEDKQDLLLRNTDEILFEMAEKAKNPNAIVEDNDYSEYVGFLNFVGNHQFFFKIMLGSGGMQLFTDRIYSYLYEVTNQRIRELPLKFDESPVPLELLIHYVAGAHLSLIKWWVLNDLPCPPDQLMKYNRILFAQDPLSLLGMDDEFLSMIRSV